MTIRPEAAGALEALARTSSIENDHDAEFGILLTEHTAPLAAYARRLTGSTTDGDDLLQDTLLRCWSARASFARGTRMGAWARTVMRNCFLSGLRRTRFEADMPENAFDRLLSVNENQSAAMDLRDVDWAMSKLNVGQREAIVLASQGVTIEEAAARLAIAPGTYKSRLWRGRERLRRLIEDHTTPLLYNRFALERKPRKLSQFRVKRRHWTGVMIG